MGEATERDEHVYMYAFTSSPPLYGVTLFQPHARMHTHAHASTRACGSICVDVPGFEHVIHPFNTSARSLVAPGACIQLPHARAAVCLVGSQMNRNPLVSANLLRSVISSDVNSAACDPARRTDCGKESASGSWF